tara:strand:- start:222 stop:1298 length:1077 start_codon:yes stop_codon:yes gene_type:complete
VAEISGGGISDGDKGDITVSSSGATFTIDSGVVSTAKIADDAITSAKIDNNAVVSAAINSGAVTTAKIADDAITSAKIDNNAVVSAAINSSAVTTAKIADDAITSAKIDNNAVVTAAINADAVTGAKIADDSIDSEHYVDGSIDTAFLANDAVTNAKIADDAVDTAQIADGAVNTARIADDAVTFAKMQNTANGARLLGRIDSGGGQIQEQTAAEVRTFLNVADGSIDGSALNASNLSSGTIPDARFPATLPAISGANLTNLPSSSDSTKLPLAGGELTGDLISHQIRPDGNGTRSLGTSSFRWSDVFTSDLHLSNKGGANQIDNSWGDFTIQEGIEDLFLINNRNGKMYKFVLQEVG